MPPTARCSRARAPIRVNQWQHVVAVVRRGENQTRLFINGFQVAKGTIAPTVLDNPKVDLHIGRIQDLKLFKGQIDGVRLYTRALGEAEIQALLAPGRAEAGHRAESAAGEAAGRHAVFWRALFAIVATSGAVSGGAAAQGADGVSHKNVDRRAGASGQPHLSRAGQRLGQAV